MGLVWLVWLVGVGEASAQSVAASTPAWSRVEIAISGMVVGGASAGDVEANLVDPAGDPLVLFRTSNRVSAGGGIEGQVSLRFTDHLAAELGAGWARTRLTSRLSGDFEGVPALSASVVLNQVTVEGDLVYHLSRRGRWAPFARAGAGWLRELTADRVLAENGLSANLSGGIKYWMREGAPGLFGRLALRAEARLLVRHGGVAFGSRQTRVSPSLVLGLVIGR